jgi:hypothetical protein
VQPWQLNILPDQIERGGDPKKMQAMEHFGAKQNQKIFSQNVTEMEQLEILDFFRASIKVFIFTTFEPYQEINSNMCQDQKEA